MPTLVDIYPNIASEWDYERNGNLTPDEVTPGSHRLVFWICPKCKQSYPMRICNRTAPSKQKKTDKCPVCLGHRIIPGFNSLKAKYPSIVEKEWDYELNMVDPDTIAPHTNSSYYWKCLNGHDSYLSRVNNKVNGNGGNCPKCSHQKPSPEFSLLSLKPDIATEWDIEANGGITPDKVPAFSNKLAWWTCSKCGHKWEANIDNRSNGKGCPKCAKGSHTSLPEQIVYHYIKKVFPDAINGYKIERKEIDIYIPSINVGIEYDGEAYHKGANKLQKDISKSELLKGLGVRLYRIRETGCPTFDSDSATVLHVRYSSDCSDLQQVLQRLIDSLCVSNGLGPSIIVDVDAVKPKIIAELYTIDVKDSFARLIEKKELNGEIVRAKWDYEENAPLKPEMFKPFSEKRVAWICPNNPNHKWINTIKSVSLGYGCPKCSVRPDYTTEEWIEKAEARHGDKYDYSKVNYINSKTPVTIICRRHGEFEQQPTEHLSGKGCKYCAHQAFHPLESLAVISPEVASEWDYEKNKASGFTPETIGIDTKRQFWWYCTNGKPHSFHATIAKRVNGHMKCAVCHGKQVSYDTSLECLYPGLAREWCSENDKKPSEVSPGSEYKALWKCPNPNHPPYQAIVGNRTRCKTGCPLCAKEGCPNKNDGRV